MMKKVNFLIQKNKALNDENLETNEYQPIRSASIEIGQQKISPSSNNKAGFFLSDKFISHSVNLIGVLSLIALTFIAFEFLVQSNELVDSFKFHLLFPFFYFTFLTIFFWVKEKPDKLSIIMIIFLTTFGYYLLLPGLTTNLRNFFDPMLFHLPFYFIAICGIAFVGKDHISFEAWRKYTNYISNLFLFTLFCFIVFGILLTFQRNQLYDSNSDYEKISDLMDNLWTIMYIVIPFFSFYFTKTNPKLHNHLKNLFIHGLIIYSLGNFIYDFEPNLFYTFFMRDRSFIIFLELTFVILLILITLMGDIETHKLFTWILKLIYIIAALAITVMTIMAMIQKMFSQITANRLIGFFDAIFYFILLVGLLILIVGFLIKKVNPITIQKWILLPIPYILIWIALMANLYEKFFRNIHDLSVLFPFWDFFWW